MFCRTALAVASATLGWCLLGAEPVQAQGFGVTSSPSTFLQCMGYGYGAGHHAPIVRSPWQEPARTQRMIFAPRYYGALEPSPYVITGCTSGYGPGDCGCGAAPTPHAAPSVEPMPVAPMPIVDSAMRDYRVADRYRWP